MAAPIPGLASKRQTTALIRSTIAAIWADGSVTVGCPNIGSLFENIDNNQGTVKPCGNQGQRDRLSPVTIGGMEAQGNPGPETASHFEPES